MHQLAVLLVGAEEAAAAHRRFERAGDLHHLIVVEDVRVHALAGALQRQLFDVVVRIAVLVVEAVADGEHQFREHGGLAVLPSPAMRFFRIERWIRRDSQLVPRPKPKVTNGVWPLAVCRVLTSYSSDWKAS